MKRYAGYTLLSVVIVSFILFSSSKDLAFAAAKKDLMITSLETANSVYADQKERYQVQVVSVDPNKPKATMKNYNGANVTVYFKNTDNKLIKSKPVFKKAGDYEGTVTLPDSGQWDVLVMALRKGEKEAADSSNVYTLTTEVAVHPPEKKGTLWAYGGILLLIVILLGLFIYMVRRQNRKKTIDEAE
ncbi:hypothetical protein PU629_21035 [Pullulanibacillus sp. KACC 23026]|uniref:hypothetical protein n=1 Tax=Pullulanibacillus sp. KACC 23026 TaxID=3028315 RepID=UPI0023AF2948|nr:hypothetical protein [Pullulanibacillus sp. KACC 23026]WEG12542.1 hypothetical protein PU629_21035 [Pullulanibacillus sp. KACC 23026]